MERTLAINALVGVGAKVITLGLGEVGRKPSPAVGVEVRQTAIDARKVLGCKRDQDLTATVDP